MREEQSKKKFHFLYDEGGILYLGTIYVLLIGEIQNMKRGSRQDRFGKDYQI